VLDRKNSRWSENLLLAALPEKDRDRLLTRLEILTVSFKEILHTPAEEITYVYFPLDCIVVLVSSVEPEATVEVGLIGNEGMVGTPVVLAAKEANSQAVVQSEGNALRLPAPILKKEISRSGVSRNLLLRYAHALQAQSTQLAACHRYHTPQARLVRWLLMTHDRTKSDEIRITQDFIAHLLGTRRATVTEAANNLQKAGLIKSTRGKIAVLDRAQLEKEACSCYQTIKNREAPLLSVKHHHLHTTS
jgi:CRP-like cAMP-binding protein